MSNEDANQTDTQTTAEPQSYPCACSHCQCSSSGGREPTNVCQDCGRGNHEYGTEEEASTT